MKSKSNNKTIFIAAGGTGGHVLPAQILARSLVKKNYRVVFVGYNLSKNDFFEKNQFLYFDITSSPVCKKNPIKMLWKWWQGFWQSRKLLLQYKPDIVIGFGSYHTFPFLLATKKQKITYLLFEANKTMGKVNRFFATNAAKVTSLFLENSTQTLVDFSTITSIDSTVSKKYAREMLALQENVFTLLIFGGSQGSSFINAKILEVASSLQKPLQIIHVTGADVVADQAKKIYDQCDISSYVVSFEKNMSYLYAAADVAIARAGAATISELICFALPAIILPYPYASEDHQIENAKFFTATIGGGKILLEKEYSQDVLVKYIGELKDDAKYRENIRLYYDRRKQKKISSLEEIISTMIT